MESGIYCIANGKLYLCRGGTAEEIRSGVLAAYLDRVRDSAQRNEWKHTGEGAVFREAYIPGADAESRLAAVFSRVYCAAEYGDALIYSISIDRTCGIYRKSGGSGQEGIVLSNGESACREFDIFCGRMAVSSAFAGECHIGVMEMGTTDCRMWTEGHCRDTAPVWSRAERDVIFYCSVGLAENAAQEPENPVQSTVQMFAGAAPSAARSPSAIMKLHIGTGALDEVLADDHWDYLSPQSTADGALYYIRRPYRTESGTSPLGCLGDIVLLPFRLIRALFGFLNVFSAKYSGKTLSKTAGVKQRDEEKLFIDGNLIHAEAELRANRSRGDKNPGIIPHSWELRRRMPDGTDELIRRGVMAYRAEDDGTVYISNGSAVLRIAPDGAEEKVLALGQVSFIRNLQFGEEKQ